MVDDRERKQGIRQGGGGTQHGEPQQAPGRNPQGDQSPGGQKGGQDREGGQGAGQKDNLEKNKR